MSNGEMTGWAAIEAAEEGRGRLCKYADPVEDAREGLEVEEAREIAHEDPSLVWLADAETEEAAR